MAVICILNAHCSTALLFIYANRGKKRTLNHRDTWELNVTEPVAGNFYPVTQTAAIRDEASGVELAVVTDRAQAAASLRPGELEFMVHRRQ